MALQICTWRFAFKLGRQQVRGCCLQQGLIRRKDIFQTSSNKMELCSSHPLKWEVSPNPFRLIWQQFTNRSLVSVMLEKFSCFLSAPWGSDFHFSVTGIRFWSCGSHQKQPFKHCIFSLVLMTCSYWTYSLKKETGVSPSFQLDKRHQAMLASRGLYSAEVCECCCLS